jgi:RNA polymerase sigma factor (sigma-70 family)
VNAKGPSSKAEDLLPTRQSLLSRLKSWEDQASWQEFFATYWKLIYTAARQAGLSDAEAQDVVQETILGVCTHMPEFRYDPQKGSFKGWLLQLTYWRIKDQFRKRLPLNAERSDQTGGNQRKLTRVRVAECKLPKLLAQIIYIHLLGLDKAKAKQTLLEGLKSSGKPGKLASFPKKPSEPQLGDLHNVPELPPHFLPRPEDLAALKQHILDSARKPVGITDIAVKTGVHGMGGIGKTVFAAAQARHPDFRQAFADGVTKREPP